MAMQLDDQTLLREAALIGGEWVEAKASAYFAMIEGNAALLRALP
jgi:hypothetical protein